MTVAFTLVEMLVVMAVIVVIISMAGPAVNALKGANDVDRAVYDVAGLIQQARAYAMASNTYVYLGVEEVDASQSQSVTPQTSGSGKQGRIGIVVIAAKDGTRGYQLSDLNGSGVNAAAFQADMDTIGRLQVFENLHLVDLGNPSSGKMVRPTPKTDPAGFKYTLADPQCLSATPFGYPLGSTASTGRYYFQKVIQFDPQGVARIQTASNSDTVTSCIEIGLQQTHGTQVSALNPPVTGGNVAAIQIDGVTGATRIYRP